MTMRQSFYRWIAPVILACFVNGGPASAAGNIQNGKALAEEQCVNCHMIGRSTPNAIESQPVGPDFMKIKKTNASKLTSRLKSSHPVMSKFPNLNKQQA